MVSLTKMEIGSLIFAFLSLLGTALGSLWYCSYIVRVYITLVNVTTAQESHLDPDVEAYYVQNIIYVNMTVTFMLSIMVVSFVFSIILTKGLLSKNSHLIKAYFIYGVTGITLFVLFSILVLVGIQVRMGLIILAVCFVYGLILTMIRKTYLQLATNKHDQKSCPKNVVEEKSISIKL